MAFRSRTSGANLCLPLCSRGPLRVRWSGALGLREFVVVCLWGPPGRGLLGDFCDRTYDGTMSRCKHHVFFTIILLYVLGVDGLVTPSSLVSLGALFVCAPWKGRPRGHASLGHASTTSSGGPAVGVGFRESFSRKSPCRPVALHTKRPTCCLLSHIVKMVALKSQQQHIMHTLSLPSS